MDAMTAVTAGMLNDVERLRVIGNNLANLTTVGYKREVAVTRPFFDHLDRAWSNASASDVGGAQPVLAMFTDQQAGTAKYTGNPSDVLIEGNGFFAIEGADGEETYTRQGNFQVDATGLLRAANGQPVIGVDGEIHLTTMQPVIDQAGNVSENGNVVGRLKIVAVADAGTLERLGNGVFGATASTEFVDAGDTRVRQGFLETANVSSMNEMVRLIETMRHFETSQRLLRGYDDMMDRAITQLGDV